MRHNFTKLRYFLFTALLMFIPLIAHSETERTLGIAVLDLQANGISPVEATALSDMLRSSITKTILEQKAKIKDSYALIERSQMDKILEQFDLQNKGCTDISCAVEFGKLLSADRIIIGSVSLVGSTYMVIARIVDVETGRAIISVDRKQTGVIDNVIDLMPLVAHELLTGEKLAVPNPTGTSPPVTPQQQPTVSAEMMAGIKMVPISGGSLKMGSADDEKGEKPLHTVILSEFEMSATEITQGQYKAVMGTNPSEFTGDDNLPVEQVSWNDAVVFCRALSQKTGREFSLPTEAEWEYACRAGTTTNYYNGDNENDLALAGWYSSNSSSKTHLVGGKTPNAWGLYDMHGNVWEWCNDWNWSYSSGNASNPTGVQTGSYRVYRGGSWLNNAEDCRSACRYYFTPDSRGSKVGFRVVRHAQ